MSRYPTHLARSPLVEAVFEMRFVGNEGRGVELLPGVILATLGKELPRLEHTPVGMIPKDIRDRRPELQHAAVFRLQGDNEAVQLGERVVSFNVTAPYLGWSKFRSRAIEVATAIKASGHVERLERYSLKYINMIESPESASPTAPFNLQVKAGSSELSPIGFRLRFETKVKDFINIVEYSSGATSTTGADQRRGTMMAIDTIMEPADPEFWTELEQRLDDIHDVIEGIFFEQLTNETLNAMEPSYD